MPMSMPCGSPYPALNLGQSMNDILDIGEGTDRPELLDSIRGHLDNISYRRKALARAETVLSDLNLSDRWLGDTLDQIPARFHQALERWQTLYAAAAAQYRKHSDLAVSPSRSSKDKKMSRRLRNEAERQLEHPADESRPAGPVRLLHVQVFRFGRLPARVFVPPATSIGVHSRAWSAGPDGRLSAAAPFPGDQRIRSRHLHIP